MFGTLLILFAAFTPWACLAQQTCYIKPRSDTPCPGEPCFTLSQYTREQCNASNTTLLFLPGTHYLNNCITFTGIDNISLLRDPQSSDPQLRIVCNNSAFFKFFEIDNLHICGFDFVSCGSDSHWGILIRTVSYCQLTNFNMQESGGMFIDNSLVSFNGNTNFVNNYGSAMVVHNSAVTFSGKCRFACNSAIYYGAAVYAFENVMLKFTGTSTFINNSALDVGGAIIADTNVTVMFSGSSQFLNNSADYGGGAVYISGNSTLSFAGNVSFANNTAQYGGGVFTENGCSIHLLGDSHFITNQGKAAGGAVYAMDSNISLFGSNHFEGNTANFGGSIWVGKSHVYFMGTNTFRNNSALGGGGIYALESVLSFGGKGNRFENNSAHDGGALSLSADTEYILQPNTTLYFDSNWAKQFGGAIRVEVRDFVYCTKNLSSSSNNIRIDNVQQCFFHISNRNYRDFEYVNVIFRDNYAGKAGSVLFGGSLETCLQLYQDVVVFYIIENDTQHVLNNVADFEENITTSMFSSYPFKICACDENKEVNCTNSSIAISAYPGQRFHVSAAVVEERERTVPAVVQVLQGGDKIGHLQNTQETNKICSDLEFAVFSSDNGSETLSLSAQGPCLGLNTFSVNVELKRCPRGFSLSDKEAACVCEKRLRHYTSTCNIDDQTILRTERFWFGFDNESGGDGLILHQRCPFYYCVDYSLNVSVNNTDLQCDSNRAGLLCGECKPGFSLTLGNPHCQECSDRYLALLIPFAVAGVVIVLLLYLLDLTVPHGTLSGLIFYANIISVTRRVFPREEFSFLQMFIAWLNLDLGIETCFYNGLDAYAKMWLQFVFPIYIWVLVGVIVIISRYSSKATKLLGTNSVSVLATLLLLSYTKVLRTILAVLSFTTLDYPYETRIVWLYDANVEFLKGKHVALFLVALIFFFALFVPYTVFLIFGQWLLAKSHLRMFNWVNRLKPFLDAYHSPYKPNHRYWPGLLLFIRWFLLLAFAISTLGNSSLDFLFVSVGATVILTWGWIAGGVYNNWRLDALEASFMLNLGILAASCYQVVPTVTAEGNTVTHQRGHMAVTYSFMSVVLLEFLGILAYHIFLKFRRDKMSKDVPFKLMSLKQLFHSRNSFKEQEIPKSKETGLLSGESEGHSHASTVSYVSFSSSDSTSDPQPSTESSLVASFVASQLREPLLSSDFHEQT